ncbi:MAG TPA: heme-binding domain-containing protein [Anaeromyxobacteraceae bacterium]|nr:heme-binding domain-containing protein [Anaeromyxobacteraceae bacterium]
MRKALPVGVALALLGAAQLVPVDRSNPPVESDVAAPPEVKAILRRACYDCHSHETVYGWHTRIAPVSWLVARDVEEGRERMNFSRWGAVGAKRLSKLRKKLPEEVAEGEMPPWSYRLAHPQARLSDADRAALEAWGRSLGGGEARTGER